MFDMVSDVIGWIVPMTKPIRHSYKPGVIIYLMHYSDVIMSTMESQITSPAIVFSMVYSGADQRKHQSSTSLAFVCEFLAQRASNSENVSIWWRHHDKVDSVWVDVTT